jgi:serine/threonine protein kinase
MSESEDQVPPAQSGKPKSLNETYADIKGIAKGGGGSVHKAIRRIDGKPVALKILKNGERFANEIAIARLVGHPRILAYATAQQLRTPDGKVKTVLEGDYFEGYPLIGFESTILATLSPIERNLVAADIASAVAVLHANNILHRDIKPENVLVCRNGSGSLDVRLIDYGVVKIDDGAPAITHSMEFLGTERTASLEALSGSGEYGVEDDAYSFGVTLLEIFLGHPWTDSIPRSDVHTFYASAPLDGILEKYYEDLPIERWLRTLIGDLVVRDRKKRLRNLSLAEEALRNGRHSDWWVEKLEKEVLALRKAEGRRSRDKKGENWDEELEALWGRRKVEVLCTGCQVKYPMRGKPLYQTLWMQHIEWDDLEVGSAFPLKCMARSCVRRENETFTDFDSQQDYDVSSIVGHSPGVVLSKSG